MEVRLLDSALGVLIVGHEAEFTGVLFDGVRSVFNLEVNIVDLDISSTHVGNM
jgi:hypothetical protein